MGWLPTPRGILQHGVGAAGRATHAGQRQGRLLQLQQRELPQWEHTAADKPGIVSKEDKIRPNLLQNNSEYKAAVKHTQSVLIHP